MLDGLGSLPAIAVAPVITGVVSIAIVLLGYVKHRSEERVRLWQTIQLLRARFGHIGRHSATNLRRLAEVYRTSPEGWAMVTVLEKMSLRPVSKLDIQPVALGLGSLVKIEDISLLPENLARDALRLDLTARNIEIDIAQAIELFRAAPDEVFVVDEPTQKAKRMESLANTIERCAADSSVLVAKLKDYEDSEFDSLLGVLLRPFALIFKRLTRLVKRNWFSSARDFTDEPIHFSDAMTLKEVGDWVNWKEERQLISKADLLDFLATVPALNPASEVELIEQLHGTINLISHYKHREDHYCLRVRVNESIFQYEVGLVKEIFVALAVNQIFDSGNARDRDFDRELALIYHRSISGELEFPLKFPLGPDVFFAASESTIPRKPYPCLVSEWVVSPSLSQSPQQALAFTELGRLIRQLHSIRTRIYYRNLRDLGEYRHKRDFSADVTDEIKRRIEDLSEIDGPKLASILQWVGEKLAEIEDFCLCHNDLHPLNVFWDPQAFGKKMYIIDWDNACISHKYLDFVKIMYWTKLSNDGRFVSDEELFEKFCQGYGEDVDRVKESPVFLALSLLWLLRVYSFERRKAASGKGTQRPFQLPGYYRDKIVSCIASIETQMQYGS